MAIRNIVKEGDPILNKVCRTVTNFDDRLATLLDDMREVIAIGHIMNGTSVNSDDPAATSATGVGTPIPYRLVTPSGVAMATSPHRGDPQ